MERGRAGEAEKKRSLPKYFEWGMWLTSCTDKKAREELAKKAGGKGPMNTGNQGIKKSGKKK